MFWLISPSHNECSAKFAYLVNISENADYCVVSNCFIRTLETNGVTLVPFHWRIRINRGGVLPFDDDEAYGCHL